MIKQQKTKNEWKKRKKEREPTICVVNLDHRVNYNDIILFIFLIIQIKSLDPVYTERKKDSA